MMSKLIALCLLFLKAHSQSLEYQKPLILDKEYINCGIVNSDQVTMVTCVTMSYLYPSDDLTQYKVKRLTIDGEVSFARKTVQSAGNGTSTITYLVNKNMVYQVFLGSTISTKLIFTIPIDVNNDFAPMIMDVQVLDNFCIVTFDNQTVVSYQRQSQLGQPLIRSRVLKLPSDPNSPNFMFSDSNLFYYIPSNKSLNVYTFDLLYQQTMRVDYSPTSMASDGQYLLIGCSECNNYKGKIDIFESGTKIGAINNTDTDNLQLGSDIVSLGNSMFHIGSNSGGMMNVRQYYSNLIRISKNSTSQNEIQFTKQSIKGVVNSPHGGLEVERNREGLIFKYSFHKGFYTANLCPFSKSYQLNGCNLCPDQTFTFSPQQQQCIPCSPLPLAFNNFQNSVANQACTIVPAPIIQPIVNNTSVDSNFTQMNNITQNNTANMTQGQIQISNLTNQSSVNQTNSSQGNQNSQTKNQTNNTQNNQTAVVNRTNQTISQVNQTNQSSPAGAVNQNRSSTNQTVNNQSTQQNMTASKQTVNQTSNSTQNNQASFEIQQNQTNKTNQQTNIYVNNQNQTINKTTSDIVFKNLTNITEQQQQSNLTSPVQGPLLQNPSQNISDSQTTGGGDDVSNFKISMGLGIGLSILLLVVIGGVCTCLYYSRKKKHDFLQGKTMKIPQKAVNNNIYETTQIGNTIEDLKSRQDTVSVIEGRHTKTNSKAVFIPQIHELRNENDPEMVHPIDSSRFDSAQIQREVEREVQHLRSLFLNGAPDIQSVGDIKSEVQDYEDNYDLESKPTSSQQIATSSTQQYKMQDHITTTNEVSRFSIGGKLNEQPKKQKKGRFFAELEKSVAGLQIDKAKWSKTAKKSNDANIDFDKVFKENQTPNTNFKDAYNINSERTELPETRRSFIKKNQK